MYAVTRDQLFAAFKALGLKAAPQEAAQEKAADGLKVYAVNLQEDELKVKQFMEQSHADGLYATFWDTYGINCQCDRCVKSGMNKFPNQLQRCVKEYNDVVAGMGKKLIVRTWSSGVPHWLGEEFVHAPGYGGVGGEGVDLWGKVFKDTPPEILIQTKVYHADCQPDARFSTLLGKAKPHTEIAEYQIAGHGRIVSCENRVGAGELNAPARPVFRHRRLS